MAVVYKITNLINQKIYVGTTIRSLDKRFKAHIGSAKRKSPCYIHRAIRKYGEENFTITILEDNIPKNLMFDKERQYIKFFNSNDLSIGYNLTEGGEGVSGHIHSKKSRRLRSEAMKRRYKDPKERKRTSEATKIGCQDPDSLKRKSESQIKRYEDPKERAKSKQHRHEYFKNPKNRKLQSLALKRRFSDPEQRRIQSENMKRYLQDPENRKKRSEASKLAWKKRKSNQ